MLYGIPPGRLQRELNSAEFAELCAFMALEPQGVLRLDYWMARLLSWVAALCGQRLKPVELLPEWWGQKSAGRITTPEGIAAVFEQFAQAQNGIARK